MLWPPQLKLQLQLTLSACTFAATAAGAVVAAGGAVSGPPKQEKLPRCGGCISASPAETAWPMT
jgi:hypothetical protein